MLSPDVPLRTRQQKWEEAYPLLMEGVKDLKAKGLFKIVDCR